MMDAEFFAFEDITWQTVPPPARYPVPARYVRDLAVGDEVTIGLPGKYFIDGQILLHEEREYRTLDGEDTPQECLAVCTPAHYWTWRIDEARVPVMQWWPVDRAWVYQDAKTQPDLMLADALTLASDVGQTWLDRVRHDADEPSPLCPIPAREAGALTGRPLRSRNAAGEWFWFVGASEPWELEGDIWVLTVAPQHSWLHQLKHYAVIHDEARAIPLPPPVHLRLIHDTHPATRS